MFDVISKGEYFDLTETDHPSVLDNMVGDLKHVQDLWVWSRVGPAIGQKVVEIGGGASRILRALSPSNERWNIDEFRGRFGGPREVDDAPGVRNHRGLMGDGSLPSDYFDISFSVSVIEHIRDPDLTDFFADVARTLKPGGTTYHAVDIYLADADADAINDPRVFPHLSYAKRRLSDLRSVAEAAGLEWLRTPQDDLGFFRCSYASNSDVRSAQWNSHSPEMRPLREVAQSCSIKMGLIKPSDRRGA